MFPSLTSGVLGPRRLPADWFGSAALDGICSNGSLLRLRGLVFSAAKTVSSSADGRGGATCAGERGGGRSRTAHLQPLLSGSFCGDLR